MELFSKSFKSEFGITINIINGPVPYIGFSYPITAESQWQDSLLWKIQRSSWYSFDESPGDERLRPPVSPRWFWTNGPEIGNPVP